jgi:hypothetical protein
VSRLPPEGLVPLRRAANDRGTAHSADTRQGKAAIGSWPRCDDALIFAERYLGLGIRTGSPKDSRFPKENIDRGFAFASIRFASSSACLLDVV